MKPDRPITAALMVLGKTLGIIIAVFYAGAIVTRVMFGTSQEASWGLTLFMMFFALVALYFGVFSAIDRFNEERHQQKKEKLKAQSTQPADDGTKP